MCMDNGGPILKLCVVSGETLKTYVLVLYPTTADYNWKTVVKTGGIICVLVLVLLAGLGIGMWYLLVRKCKLIMAYL